MVRESHMSLLLWRDGGWRRPEKRSLASRKQMRSEDQPGQLHGVGWGEHVLLVSSITVFRLALLLLDPWTLGLLDSLAI
jgi:hypothetical protein